MIVIRNVFRCKPGQAKKLVEMFKATITTSGGAMGPTRILTDLSAPFWTVVFENEAESLAAWETQFNTVGSAESEARKHMAGYMDLVEGGHREIFKIE
ncbi:MAG: hypothetical protein ABI718_01860 [Acidobacteriota bacterium]